MILFRNLERRQRLLARISGRPVSEFRPLVIKDTFRKFVDKKSKGLSECEVAAFTQRLFLFLNRAASINRGSQSTSSLTSLYAHMRKGGRSLGAGSWGEFKRDVCDLMMLCQRYRVDLKSITGMQHGLGVPRIEDLEALLTWCRKNNVDLKSITGMQMGLGVPKIEDLNRFLATNKISPNEG